MLRHVKEGEAPIESVNINNPAWEIGDNQIVMVRTNNGEWFPVIWKTAFENYCFTKVRSLTPEERGNE